MLGSDCNKRNLSTVIVVATIMQKGEDDVDNIDILGNTTESAIQATSQALYDLDHPREYVPKSIEVQRACMKEREFYVAFLEKLEKLKVKI